MHYLFYHIRSLLVMTHILLAEKCERYVLWILISGAVATQDPSWTHSVGAIPPKCMLWDAAEYQPCARKVT